MSAGPERWRTAAGRGWAHTSERSVNLHLHCGEKKTQVSLQYSVHPFFLSFVLNDNMQAIFSAYAGTWFLNVNT